MNVSPISNEISSSPQGMKEIGKGRVVQILVAMLICVFPAIPLFFTERHPPTVDWENHAWMIHYYKEHFRHHGSFPDIIHTHQVIGLPTPIFYGNHFYRLAALISMPFGANDWGLRIFLGVLIVGKFWLVRSLFSKVTRDWFLGTCIAALAVWEIYAMTNMYNRAAITEVVAGSFLLCGVAAFLHGCFSQRRSVWMMTGALLMTLSAGTHPTTAVLGTATLVGIGVATALNFPAARRYAMLFVTLALACQALGLLPWLYALKTFQGSLHVMRSGSPGYQIIPELHGWAPRLAPFPFDPRTTGNAAEDLAVSTAYLDGQINVALLVALLGFAVLWARRARTLPLPFLLTLGGFVLLLWLSVTYGIWSKLPPVVLNGVQYPYRLTAFCNLLLLVGFFLLASHPAAPGQGRGLRVLLLCCLGLAAVGVALKIPRSVRVLLAEYQLQPYKWQTHPAYTFVLTERFYGMRDYSTPSLYQPPSIVLSTNTQILKMRVDMETNWGAPLPVSSTHEREERALVNSLAFPWNVLYVDGKRFDASNTEAASNFALVKYGPGTHETRYSFEPPGLWRNLKRFSDAFVILLFVSVPLLCWKARRTQN